MRSRQVFPLLPLLAVSAVAASTFRSRIEKFGITQQSQLQRRHMNDRAQNVIGSQHDHTRAPWMLDSQTANGGLPVESSLYFAYRTIIGIGTKPAQLMRAMIDIDWADMIVPSANCTDCPKGPKYNCSQSPTYETNGTDLVIRTGGYTWGEGFVAQDTITVGDGIIIPRHPFLEANRSSPCVLCGSDTILGLAIDKPEYVDPSQCSSKGKYNSGGCLPSPFSTLARSGRLDRNVVSILLPRDEDDIRVPPGDIMFGGLDEDLYEGHLTTHPLYPPGTTQWHIEATSASVSSANGTLLASEPLPGYTARLHTHFPFTALPPFIGNAILNATGADCSDSCKGCEVNCSTLHELPHVTFNLGGHNITITGQDYTVKTDIWWPFCAYPGEYCTVNIGPNGGDGGEESKTIDLGTSFLRGVYSAYDFDDRSVHLAKAKRYISNPSVRFPRGE